MTPSQESRALYRSLGEGWSFISYIITGVLLWGGIGMLADRFMGIYPVLTVIGAIVGNFAGIYLIYVRVNAEAEDTK